MANIGRTGGIAEQNMHHFMSNSPWAGKAVIEAVQDEVKSVNGKPKDQAFFESTMASAFAEGHRILREDGVGCVVFAHSTTEGTQGAVASPPRPQRIVLTAPIPWARAMLRAAPTRTHPVFG